MNRSGGEERQEIISSLGNIPSESTIEIYLNKSIDDLYDSKISAAERLSFVFSVIESGRVSFIIDFLSWNLVTYNSKIGSVLDVFKTIAERILSTETETEVRMAITYTFDHSIQIRFFFCCHYSFIKC